MRTNRVYENVPTRGTSVWVAGWEPLGNICNTTTAKKEAEPYLQLEQAKTGSFNGSWGKHYFTIANLLKRALARWNYWSHDWSSYDYVRYVGATVKIIPPQDQNWMINLDPYFQFKKGPFGSEKDKEDLWDHPGILLHTPHTHLIFSQNTFRRRTLYKIKCKPPPGWKGYLRFPEAFDYILLNWVWTWWNPFKAFWDPVKDQAGSSCEAEPWWSNQQQLAKWVNRTKYDDIGNPNAKDWGPFLPSKLGNQSIPASIWFMYKIHFKLAGDSIWRPLPRNFTNDGMVPAPEGPNAGTKTHSKKRKRPYDEADILPGDLDSDGILKDRSYKRITADHKRSKQRDLQQVQRTKYLARKFEHLIRRFGEFTE